MTNTANTKDIVIGITDGKITTTITAGETTKAKMAAEWRKATGNSGSGMTYEATWQMAHDMVMAGTTIRISEFAWHWAKAEYQLRAGLTSATTISK